MKYFFCLVTEWNGCIEYTSSFLMTAKPDENLVEKWDQIILNYRGKGERQENSGLIWYPDSLAANDDADYREISEEDYAVMRKYLSTL